MDAPYHIVELPKRLNWNIVRHLSPTVLRKSDLEFERLWLDCSKAEFVSLSAALYLLLTARWSTLHGPSFKETKLVLTDSAVLKYFNNLSLLTFLANYGKLSVQQELLKVEADRRMRRRAALKGSHQGFYLPIQRIGAPNQAPSFESEAAPLVNQYYDFIEGLNQTIGTERIGRTASNELFTPFYEIIKNSYDHSTSEGYGAITYFPGKALTISFMDIGIGIAANVRKHEPKPHAQALDYFKRALDDGYTTTGHHGRGNGFSILKNYATSHNGTLAIRSTGCQLLYEEGKERYANVPWFPGCQVTLYIPLSFPE